MNCRLRIADCGLTHSAIHNPQSAVAAFTLLELVLVMVIIGTVLAMAAPSLRGWSRAARLRDAGQQVLAITRLARTQAITSATVYRLNINSQAGQYWITQQQAEQFVNLGSSLGRVYTVPPDSRIELTKSADDQAPGYVEFYPTGRTQPAVIRLSDDAGRVVRLQCSSPAENFVLATGREGA
jgi:type II secretion system protein H